MTLVKCNKCGKLISNKAEKCLYCNTKVKKEVKEKKTGEKKKVTTKCEICGKRYKTELEKCPYCNIEEEKKYYKHLDLLRIIFCISVLLYHMHYLKGGFLAVCSFFVLSSYLAVISAFKTKEFDLGKYYKSRLLKLYLPTVIVVFLTIPLVSSVKNLIWLNLRPETTSVLFGYNNLWQIQANLDYFARHTTSPFIHLWYIAILMQFELIFPFIFMLFRKLGDKVSKKLPWILSFIMGILSFAYFCYSNLKGNTMFAYYHTLTRAFALFFGLGFGFMHSYYGLLIPKVFQEKKGNIIFYLYLILSIILFVFISSDSPFLNISMAIITIISCRLIEYGIANKSKLFINDYIMQTLSGMTLWIYLFQYPLIYLFQYVNLNEVLKMILMIILLICLSFILFYIFKKEKKYKWLQIGLVGLITGLTIWGAYKYCTAKDYTEEMDALETQLLENAQKAEESQKEYEKKLEEARENLNNTLNDIDSTLNNLDKIVLELPILGIGDSIMLGASPTLEEKFVNSHFDGQKSRQIWASYDSIEEYKKNDTLGNPIVINLGANGNCGEEYKRKLIESFGDRDIFWATVTNNSTVKINDSIKELAQEYDNLYVFDWEALSKGHSDYFAVDGIHLTSAGADAYANGLYDTIYKVYEERYKKLKEDAIKDFENQSQDKYSFYGNEILINAFDLLKEDYKEDAFNLDSDYTFNSLKDKINKDIESNSINKKVVIALDEKLKLTKDNYEELITLLKDKKIYILIISKDQEDIFKDYKNDFVTIINFYEELKKNEDKYYIKDKKYLSLEGNKALIKLLNTTLKGSNA